MSGAVTMTAVSASLPIDPLDQLERPSADFCGWTHRDQAELLRSYLGDDEAEAYARQVRAAADLDMQAAALRVKEARAWLDLEVGVAIFLGLGR